MPSSKAGDSSSAPPWLAAGLRYHSLSHYLRLRFGHRVWKVSVDGRLGCPNVDGTLGTAGCIFCNVRSFSPSRRMDVASITEQINEGIRRLQGPRAVDRFLAYFQPGTNTHAPVGRLRELWEEAIEHPNVVGLVVGTRPDCVPDDVLDLLAEFSRQTWLSVEYGLQTIHDRSLAWLGRRHGYDAFLDAVERSRRRKLRLGAHVILGLPGETRDDMLSTARELARLRIESVKLHNLYVARDTPLAGLLAAGELELPDRDQYAGYAADFLEELPPQCVIDRLSADAPPEYLVAPTWCLDKSAVRAAIEGELVRRDTWQGRKHGPAD
ncbi:MAG: TIGR01212 family radical SAM protein [Planctomycetota bacterium]